MQKIKHITLGVGSTFFAKVIGSLCQITTLGVIARHVTLEQLGIWSMLISIVILAPSFDFGIGGAYLRNEMTKLIDDKEKGANFFFFVFTFLLLFYGFFSLLLGAMGGIIPTALMLIAMRIPFSMSADGFYGFHEIHIRGLLDGIEALFLSLTALCAVKLNFSFDKIVLLYFSTYLALAVLAFFYFVKKRKWRYRFVKVKEFNFRVGLMFWGVQALGFALFTQLPLFIGLFYGAKSAGEFALIYRPISLLVGTQFSLLNPLWSHYTAASLRGDKQWVRKSHRWTLILVIVGSLIALGVYLPLHSQIIYLWAGQEVIHWSWAISCGFWALLYGVINCYAVVLNALSRPKQQLMTLAIGLIVMTLGALVLSIDQFLVLQMVLLFVILIVYRREFLIVTQQLDSNSKNFVRM